MTAPNDSTDWSTVTVSTAELALFLGGISTTMVERYAREHEMPKAGPGRFPLLACVVWRLNRQRESRPQSVEAARQRQLTASAEKLESYNRTRAGELLEASQVTSVLAEVAAVLGSNLDSLGPRLAGPLATETEPAKIQRTIQDETRSMRRQAADQLDAIGRRLADVSDPAPTPEPQRRAVGRRKPRAAPRKPRAGAVAD